MKFRYRLTILAVLILFISAMTVCPVVGNDCSSVDQSCLVSSSSFDEQDVFYLFTTSDSQQGVVWERMDTAGVPRAHGIMIGDQFAVLREDDTDHSVAVTSNGYTIVHDKHTDSVLLLDDDSVTALPLDETVFSQVQVSATSNSTLASAVKNAVSTVFSSPTTPCVLGGVLLVLGYPSPFLCSCFMNPAEAQTVQIYEYLPITAEIGTLGYALVSAESLLAASGIGLIGAGGIAIAYFVYQKHMERQLSGEPIRITTIQDAHLYKYEIDITHKKATIITHVCEVAFKDGVLQCGGDIIKFRGKEIHKLSELPQPVHEEFLKMGVKEAYISANYYLLDSKTYNPNGGALNWDDALNRASKCPPSNGGIWIGCPDEESAHALAQAATENINEYLLKKSKTALKKMPQAIKHYHKGQPPHYHPSDENKVRCPPHICWDYKKYQPKTPQKRSDL